MSGQQIGTIVGQVIGGYFGGAIGAGIGGAIGGAIGGSFDPDIVHEGPRLTDLKIQTSSYGNAIPIIYGTCRIAGNVIWATDIRETRLETEEGKGGPQTIQVDYRYDMDVAIAVGEPPTGEIFVGVERIYAHGVLIYDTRAGASPAAVFASGQWATGTHLYPGNFTQLPDPTMEAALGVGNVAAYRGTGYVVITGLQLNVLKVSSLPNFEFVVTTSGDVEVGRQLLERDDLSPVYQGPLALSNAQPFISNLSQTIRVANTGDLLTRIYDLSGDELGIEPRTEDELEFPAFSETGAPPFVVWKTFDGVDALASGFGVPVGPGVFEINGADMLDVVATADTFVGVVASVDERHYMVLTAPVGNKIDQWWLLEWDGLEPILVDQGTIDTTGLSTAITNVWNVSPVYQATGAHYLGVLESDLRHAWHLLGQDLYVWEINPQTNVMSRVILFEDATLPRKDIGAAGVNLAAAIFADNGLAAIVTGAADASTSYLFLYSRLAIVDPDGVSLVDILTDLSERSNLPASEISFVGINDFVYGFPIGTTMSARAAMENLRQAYFFDTVDSDTFKFVKRGAGAVVDIEYGDLGAAVGQATLEAVNVTRSQETERPSRVNVKYLSLAADFQPAAQSARRETTGSRETAEVNLSIVFDTDDEPARIADVLLRDRWAGAVTRSFVTTIDYAKYEPTDVVTLDDGFAVRTERLTRRVDKGLLIEWESADEDVAAYDSNAIAVPITIAQQTIIAQVPSAFEVLDIPPLTELPDGNESAAYVAAKGYSSPWPGAGIDISRNAGATYETGTAVTTASVMGAALTALQDFTGGNVFDESSTVRVSVGAGTLSSATRLEVLNGANPCVIGDEVLQFTTPTLVSAGVYDLTGFLRGRKGTEWAMGTHLSGDRFVMLSTRLRNLPLQLGDRVLDRLLVRATTGSMLVSEGVVRGFEPVIARLMPYSPTHLSATRDASGNWVVTWVRRDRYMNDWLDSVDIAMSETYELYDVEVYDGATLLTTYVDVADTEQAVPVAVLGGIEASITVRVFQKSSIVGRGFPAEATITQA